MFSFRTTAISEQLDKGLTEGRVACFCTPSSWNSATGEYLVDFFRSRGNLARVFSPVAPEFSPDAGHIDFGIEDLEGLDAVVVDIQDVGSRYFPYTRDVLRLLSFRARMEEGPSIYIIDHINPAGRVVEGTIPVLEPDLWTPKVAHRHGLTLAELCNLYCSEIGARFPLHIISALCSEVGKDMLPWTIPPAPDFPGLFTCQMYSGGGLWSATAICPGTGTPRPYEYHSLLHTVQLMRWFADRDSRFEITEELLEKINDPVISEYLKGGITFDIVQEHVKIEEQKWIRKAKRFLLYEDSPYRIK